MRLVRVEEQCTQIVGRRFLNSQICVCISLCQIVVCIYALAQHISSFTNYHEILHCDFINATDLIEKVDAVIFDIGLFHSLWGIRGCIAEYLDGGFLRLFWCVSHISSLISSLPIAYVRHPRPTFLWPLLLQQSIYGVCLLILTTTMLPKLFILLSSPTQFPAVPMVVYITGTTLNLFHLYVYYHWYWHVAKEWGSVVKVKFGQVLRNANNRSRRDKPMVPKFKMPEEMFEDPDADILDDPNHETPPPPIVATKLTWDSYENQTLREQASFQIAGIHDMTSYDRKKRRRSSGGVVELEEHIPFRIEQAVVEYRGRSDSNENRRRKYERNPGIQRYEKNRAAQRRQKYPSNRQKEFDYQQKQPPTSNDRKSFANGPVKSMTNGDIQRGTGRKLPETPNLPMHGELPLHLRSPRRHLFELDDTKI